MRVKLESPKLTVEEISDAIEKVLSPNERKILSMRLPWNQIELAKELGLTKQRIQAIEVRVLEKILQEIRERKRQNTKS